MNKVQRSKRNACTPKAIDSRPIRNPYSVISHILDGVSLDRIKKTLVMPETLADCHRWSMTVGAAQMVADRLATPAVNSELDAFYQWIDEVTEIRSIAAHRSIGGAA